MRAVVNVSTGRYVSGLHRLHAALNGFDGMLLFYRDSLPTGSPTHAEAPYAFKAAAMREAIQRGATTVLWADASIVPRGDMEPLWQHIEREGYWIDANGWSTSQWCVDSALGPLGITREQAMDITHPVATTFAIDTRCAPAMAAFEEWERLAMEGTAFQGPWRIPPCIDRLPEAHEVGGHRHDQTALGVVAWRHGLTLTREPRYFAYAGGEAPETVLVATCVT